MDVFKTTVGVNESYEISEGNFSNQTKKIKPFYENVEGRHKCYAVCPICDNPIQIIGLYKKEEQSTKKPYGRHYKGSIYHLAHYDEAEYLNCPYANPNRNNVPEHRRPDHPKCQQYYHMMKTYFDKIIYILGNALDIFISPAFAKILLENWINYEGWTYFETTYENLPFMLLYAEPAYSLFGKIISKNGELHTSLTANGKNFAFTSDGDNYVQVGSKKDAYLNSTYYIHHHTYETEEEHLTEYFLYDVTENNETIYQKKIVVHAGYLAYLIRHSGKETERSQRLKEIAKEVFN